MKNTITISDKTCLARLHKKLSVLDELPICEGSNKADRMRAAALLHAVYLVKVTRREDENGELYHGGWGSYHEDEARICYAHSLRGNSARNATRLLNQALGHRICARILRGKTFSVQFAVSLQSLRLAAQF